MDSVLEAKKEKLRSEWESYIHSEHTSLETRRIIMESWERCSRYGISATNEYPLHVLPPSELDALKEKNRELIEISAPVRQRIADFIQGSHFLIVLTDASGILLEITGDARMKQSVVGGGFIEGADWSEQSAGSNAVGTALAADRPMQFAGYEHYCVFTQKTACAAAPVHDSDGKIIGSIDLTGRLREVNQHTLGIAVAMASDIENCLRISQAQKKLRLENAYKDIMLESMTQGVIALNEKNRITHMNHSAKNILHLTGNYIGKDVKPILSVRNPELLEQLTGNISSTDREFTVRTERQSIRIIGTSRNIVDDRQQRIGTIFIFDEIRRAQRIAARYTGATARLTFDDIVGHNPNFKRTLELAQTAARSDASILLLGESGVGKDIMAQAIHNASTRRNNPYVAINCGAIPRELIASELFGYQEGAYTGARKGGNAGKFEIADGGTVFLDEIGEMSLDLQVHLLRVLENHTITRVGGSEAIPVNVRIIAATNADLFQSVQNGLFRSDLYYRLNVISLHLPPLRERRDDIPSLIRHFYSQYYDGTPEVPEEFEEVLCEYSWPGNIRELRNIIERTVSLSPDKQLRTDYLPSHLTAVQEPEPGYAATLSARSEPVTVSELEKEALIARLRATNGNISRTAKELGVARTTIYRKIRQHHIDLESINWKQKNNPLFEDTDQAFPNAQPSSFR